MAPRSPLSAAVIMAGLAFASPAIAGTAIDWAAPADYGALRREYGYRADYEAVCEDGRPSEGMIEAINARQFVTVAEIALPWLGRCPVDIQAHLYRMAALQELGRLEEADLHRRWVRGLLDSILATGDGKTPETAYEVIAIREERMVILLTGMEWESQALTVNPMRDAVEARRDDGTRVTVFFNPDAHFQRLGRKVTGASASDVEQSGD